MKRKAPAKAQLVARSIRGENERKTTTNQHVKRKQDTTKNTSKNKSPVFKPKLSKRKSTFVSENSPKERKALQKRNKLLASLDKEEDSPTRYSMPKGYRGKICQDPSCKKCKIKKSRQCQKAKTSSGIEKQQSFEHIKDWPSLEYSRRKGSMKEAATELVKNKQSGTIAQLSKQMRTGIASPREAQCSSKTTDSENSKTKNTLQKTWASIVGSSNSETINSPSFMSENIPHSNTYFPTNESKTGGIIILCDKTNRHDVFSTPAEKEQTTHSESMDVEYCSSENMHTLNDSRPSNESKNKGIFILCDQKSRHNILSTPLERRQTIQNRRESQRLRASDNVVANGDPTLFINKKPTSRQQNRGLKWKIDHMPDGLRCTQPVNGSISLHGIGAIRENNINICNSIDRNIFAQSPQQQSLIQSATIDNGASSTNERAESDICNMMHGVSVCPENQQSTSGQVQNKLERVQNKKHNCRHKAANNPVAASNLPIENKSPPKKISERYRALMRREDNRMGSKHLSEEMGSDRLVRAAQVRKSSRIQNAKKIREEMHQRSRDDPLEAAENFQSTFPHLVATQEPTYQTAQEASIIEKGEATHEIATTSISSSIPSSSDIQPERKSIECSPMEVDSEQSEQNSHSTG